MLDRLHRPHYPAGFVLAAAIAALAAGAGLTVACDGCQPSTTGKPVSHLLKGDAGLCDTIVYLGDGGLSVRPCDFGKVSP